MDDVLGDMEAYILNTKLELDPNATSLQKFRRRSSDMGSMGLLGLPGEEVS